jgi:hypothetical protein
VRRGSAGRTGASQALDQHVEDLALQQHVVRARLAGGPVEVGRGVAGEGDQADARMVAAQACGGRDSVEQRHVEVEDDRVGLQFFRELDRLKPVDCGGRDLEFRLAVDQLSQRAEEGVIVVGYEDADRSGGGVPHEVHGRQS